MIGSYFEWVQDIQEIFWTPDEEARRLELVMTRTVTAVLERRRQEGVSLRQAALMIGIERIAAAQTVRGLYP